MFRGLEHVGLTAPDPEALGQWYARVLGFRIIFRTPASPPAVFVAAEQGMFEILPEAPGGPQGPPDPRTHLAIAVDDFDAALAKLKAEGVELEGEPLGVFQGGRVVFFRDPAGHRLHLIYRPVLPWKG